MPSPPTSSDSRNGYGARSARWLASAPAIVADALVPVPDPIAAALRPGPVAPPAAVASALARSLAPPESSAAPPGWLRDDQHRSFRRVLATLARYGGACLADPVGSGKTYVALAAAATWNPTQPTTCLTPAHLAAQWRRVAARLDVHVVVWSHEQVSRGRLPRAPTGLVIIDESHHFRNPRTRRYQHVAPWLIGRPLLLVTATPVVNRLSDLAHQLRLGVRDDALAIHGVPSLLELLAGGEGDVALGELVIAERTGHGDRPARRFHAIESSAEPAEWIPLATAIDALRLSTAPPIAALIRGAFWRALASSPAVGAAALRRYRRLLLHAQDAAVSGRLLTRAELYRFTGALDDQLVLWELLPDGAGAADLALDDLAALESLICHADRLARVCDPKVHRLKHMLSDERRTLVFVSHRATVRYLRDRLGDPAVAWCTGDHAGIGTAALPRSTVLGWFRPDAPSVDRCRTPTVLVTTDVAAEGLDLHAASRVIHYDLPWTPMRLDQREGRAVRLGSSHREVDVMRFDPPAVLELRLRQVERLARKRRLPEVVGIAPDGRRLWRWRSEAADEYGRSSYTNGIAVVHAGPAGVLAGFAVRGPVNSGISPFTPTVVWVSADGAVSEDPDLIEARLAQAAAMLDTAVPPTGEVTSAVARMAGTIRQRLRSTQADRWAGTRLDAASRRLIRRLQSLARRAVRARDADLLTQIERALGFAAGGHTAGESLLISRLAEAPLGELRRALGTVPAPSPRPEATGLELTGLILFLERHPAA